jgi:hypothetical protein
LALKLSNPMPSLSQAKPSQAMDVVLPNPSPSFY